MPENASVTLTPTSLPSGFCPATEQERFNMYMSRATGVIPGTYSTFVYSAAKPAAIDQNKPWIRLNADGSLDRIYTFSNGVWRSPHNVPTNFVNLYWGDITSIATFDGGSVGSVTPSSGPFWEEVTEARGRFPIHPDPNKTLLKTAIASKGTGGEELHQLTANEIPDHVNKILGANVAAQYGTGALAAVFLRRDVASGTVIETTSSGGGDLPHNNMPPYIGIHLIRRTARLYYIVP